MKRTVAVSLMLLSGALLQSHTAAAGLYLPDTIDYLEDAGACGVRADYALSGAILRVEIITAGDGQTLKLATRVYQPNSVGPLMRDVWIKSQSFFSLGRFKPARENSNGILETRGELPISEGKVFFGELSNGAIEISIIYDGVMPVARLPVGLPAPLPDDLVRKLKTCWTARSQL